MTQQIKSRERVKDLAEVFTNPREVKGMLDLVDDFTKDRAIKDKLSYRIETTFLEPACGTGNFLVELLDRKLNVALANHLEREANPKQYSGLERYVAFDIFRSLSSIYGIDIDEENVAETRERLLKIVEGWWAKNLNSAIPELYTLSFREVLLANIILGNSLTEKSTITFLDYGFPAVRPFHINYSAWTIQEMEDKAQDRMSDNKPVSRMIKFENFSARKALAE